MAKGSNHRLKEFTQLAEGAGLTVTKVIPGSHHKFYVRNTHGIERMVVVGSSTSCDRAMLATRALLRRIAKELPA